MAKVYDVFTFFNELELLEMRLEILDKVIDKFVLIECVETFSGKPKPLYYEENRGLFGKFNHKIIHHVTRNPPQSFEDLRNRIVDDASDDLEKQVCVQALTSNNVPPGELHWLKEFYQKENIRRALIGLEDDDYCFITDLDEVWHPDLSIRLRAHQIEDNVIYKLRQLSYSMYLNNRSSEPWAGTLLTKYKNIKNSCLNHLRTPSKTEYEYVDNGGWHFTFMGGAEQIKKKIESYGHQEYNNDSVKNNVENRLKNNQDVLGRDQFEFWIDERELPEYVLQNKSKYAKFFKSN